jgi:hypothetical protein
MRSDAILPHQMPSACQSTKISSVNVVLSLQIQLSAVLTKQDPHARARAVGIDHALRTPGMNDLLAQTPALVICDIDVYPLADFQKQMDTGSTIMTTAKSRLRAAADAKSQ